MRHFTISLSLLVLAWLQVEALGQKASSETPTPEEIIRRFSDKESEFRDVWEQYTYTQDIYFQVLSQTTDHVKESRHMVIEVYFTTDGERQTRIVKDEGELNSVRVTREDISDATSLQPFVLTREERPNYRIDYVGKEVVDELETYVFDVKPRKQERGKRYFKGRIWVDDQDFQIVMTKGKAVPDSRDNKFPEFETVREQIDGKYWFPTWTMADDILRFGDFMTGRRDVRVRQLTTFEDFKRFEVGTTIRFETEDEP